MSSLTQPETAVQDVLLYGRNSTDDQAEAGTIQSQQHFLRHYAQLYSLRIVGQFWDEGASGTIPLEQRREGRALLEAARARSGAVVLVYRLDRLGRSLRVLLEAHDALQNIGVSIRSGTEPFDSSTPIGKFLFQLLASLAELDRANLLERMTRGRDRVIRSGRWVSGTIPFGYELGPEATLQPSTKRIDQVDMTEADLVVDVFRRIAGGSSATAEAVRLNALGITAARACASGRQKVGTGLWKPDRIVKMIHKPLYAGTHVHRSKNGTEIVPVPPLIDEQLRAAAEARLGENRRLSSKNAKRVYLLRGLVECAACGCSYVGATHAAKKTAYYYCTGAKWGRKFGGTARACDSRMIRGEDLEVAVWADCAAFLRNPGPALAEAQRQLRARLTDLPKLEAQRARLVEGLAEKDAERERVMTLYRRARITLEEAERQIDDVQREAAHIREQIESIRTSEELADAAESQYADAVALTSELATKVDQIEASGDPAAKRAIIEHLVRRVVVAPAGDGVSRARVTYRFSPGVLGSFASYKHEDSPHAPQIALDFKRTVQGEAPSGGPDRDRGRRGVSEGDELARQHVFAGPRRRGKRRLRPVRGRGQPRAAARRAGRPQRARISAVCVSGTETSRQRRHATTARPRRVVLFSHACPHRRQSNRLTLQWCEAAVEARLAVG